MKKSDLARMLEVSHPQATKYVNGINQPKIEYLVTIGEHFNVAIDDLILVDLSKHTGRPYGQGSTEQAGGAEEQTLELNRLLRLRVAELERNIKRLDAGRARELGIE